MTKIILCGCTGRMGTAIANLSRQEPNFEIAIGIAPVASSLDFPVYSTIALCNTLADVIIDYMPGSAVNETLTMLEYGVTKKIPMVICSTGLSDEVQSAINEASKQVAIFQSPNMSLGISLITNMLQRMTKLFHSLNFDIEIVESHHKGKVDSPSGTACLLANTINKSLGNKMKIVNGRDQNSPARDYNEIGVHSIRGGSIIGEHKVMFAGQDETVEFKHIAESRDTFAIGTLKAAKFIISQPPRLYDMQDLINSKLKLE